MKAVIVIFGALGLFCFGIGRYAAATHAAREQAVEPVTVHGEFRWLQYRFSHGPRADGGHSAYDENIYVLEHVKTGACWLKWWDGYQNGGPAFASAPPEVCSALRVSSTR